LPQPGGELLAGDPRTVLSRLDLGPPLVQLGKALGWTPLPLTIKEALRFSRAMTVTAKVPARNGEAPVQEKPVLEVQKLTVHYQRQPVLHGVSFTLAPGEVVVLMGRNGVGKSTLLKSLVGLVRPQGGQITLQGRSLIGQEPAVICRTVGYLPQDPNALLFADSVREELLITLRNHGLATTPEGQRTLTTLLDQLGLADKAAHYPRDLSVGERQRTALAAILVTRPRVLLLDEPTRGLDTAAKQRLVELLHAWRRDGIATLLVTHDVELAAAVADRVLLMSQGEIIATGSPHTVLSASPLFAPQVARLFPGTGWLTAADVLSAGQA
jgi:energy-coupling factor transport system ATP-binding protein